MKIILIIAGVLISILILFLLCALKISHDISDKESN